MLPAALTRLMRKLRGLGLDTAILREGAPQRELVETAENEDRSLMAKLFRSFPAPRHVYDYTVHTGHSLYLCVFSICQSIIVSVSAFVQNSHDLHLACSMK